MLPDATHNQETPVSAGLEFLSGGGEMGMRMRTLDWSKIPLGRPARWPQSLKSIVRVMLDSRYPMWMLWGPDLTFLCNDAYLPTVGIRRDWVLGARCDKVWEEIWPDIGPRIQQVLEHGQATWDEGLLLNLERSGFFGSTYHTFSYSPVYDNQNRIAGMLCVAAEVTRRVLGERRLQALRDLAAASTGVQSVPEACDRLVQLVADYPSDVPFMCVYLIDDGSAEARLGACQGQIPEYLRPGNLSLCDQTSPWPIGTAARGAGPLIELSVLEHKIFSPLWQDPISKAIALPVRSQGRLGVTAVLLVGVSPRLAFDEDYRGFLEVMARQFAASLADAQALEGARARAAALAEIARAKTTFFSNVSHEFRTPLTLLLSPIEEMLSDPALPAHVLKHLELARRNGVLLMKLVNSLLDFARIESDRRSACFQPVDLAEITRELASTFRTAMESADLRFDVDCPCLDQPVFIDREMWQRIVLNLLSNAYKFTLNGSVAVRLRSEPPYAVLEISDTGVGIPQHELPRLFERFHQIAGVRGRPYEGSGIGLALVQELVKLHGGTATAQSAVGAGTTFTVRVPFGNAHLNPDHIGAEPSESQPDALNDSFIGEAFWGLPSSERHATSGDAEVATDAAAEDASRITPCKPRVLLAEDNADMCAYVARILSAQYQVTAVADGEAALANARETRPELILSDVMMPKLDGFGLINALRADRELASIPVILLSALAGEEATVEGLKAGADDYLLKPFSARELLARVGGAIAANMRRETAEKLRIGEERFRAVQEASPDGFAVLEAVRDKDGTLIDFISTYVNPALAHFVGVPREALLGERLLENYSRVMQDDLFAWYSAVAESGTPWLGEHHYKHEGQDVYLRMAVARVGDGVAVSIVDLSDRRRAEEALKRADRQKDEFLAMLAHELRNPLAPIGNAIDIIGRSLTADSRESSALGMARRQFLQLTRVVDDLLDVARVTEGRIDLQREKLEVSEIIAHALEMVEPLARAKEHEISVTNVGFQPLYINADRARILQCVVNVLTNAVKYTDHGGRIQLQTRMDASDVLIEVTDSGVGIAADLLPNVFELFVQGARTLDRSQGGLGIGLALVKRLAEMHEGSASARSAGAGQGSTFEIRLPATERPAPTRRKRQRPDCRRSGSWSSMITAILPTACRRSAD